MNLTLYTLEHIVEVAKCGSISKAAQNLFLSQPHLSNTIKAAEQELGVSLFRRSAKGMTLTEEGRLFVKEARGILERVQDLQMKIQVKPEASVRTSISITRSYQVNRCVTRFINDYANRDSMVLHVKETNPFQVVKDVASRESELGVLHFFDAQKAYFLNSFQAHGLKAEQHYKRKFLLAVSENNPLASATLIEKEMLKDQVVVIYGDYEIPPASYEAITKVSDIVLSRRRVYVYERASAMEMLKNCPNTYMWITGLHPDTLSQYGLVLRECADVEVVNLGYSIYSEEEPLSWCAEELLRRMIKIDWQEKIRHL